MLAGGLARRMGGQDKGLVCINNKPMASWVVDALVASVHSLVINANRNLDRYQLLGVPVVADTLSGHLGPLAGLSAALGSMNTDYVFMCPCDSPFITPNLLDHMGYALLDANSDIAVAHDGLRMQPVFAVVSRRCTQSLNEFLESGERKIDRWYGSQNMIEVPSAEFAACFQNINTEPERLSAERALMDTRS